MGRMTDLVTRVKPGYHTGGRGHSCFVHGLNDVVECRHYATLLVLVDRRNKMFAVNPKKYSLSSSCAVTKYRTYLIMHGYLETNLDEMTDALRVKGIKITVEA